MRFWRSVKLPARLYIGVKCSFPPPPPPPSFSAFILLFLKFFFVFFFLFFLFLYRKLMKLICVYLDLTASQMKKVIFGVRQFLLFFSWKKISLITVYKFIHSLSFPLSLLNFFDFSFLFLHFIFFFFYCIFLSFFLSFFLSYIFNFSFLFCIRFSISFFVYPGSIFPIICILSGTSPLLILPFSFLYIYIYIYIYIYMKVQLL